MDEGAGALAQPVSAGMDEGTGASAQPASGTGEAQIDGAAEDTENLLAQPTMAASAAAQGIHASYTIRMGDTLADICNQYYGSLDKLELLCQVNHISDANLIMPGQRIVLP